LNELNI